MRRHLIVASLCLAGACGSAAKNPERPSDPSPWQPPPHPAEDTTTPTTTAPIPPAKNARSLGASDANAAPPAATSAAATSAAAAPATVDDVKPAVPAPQEPIVATVANQPIYVSELLSQWLYTDPLQVREHLDNLTLHRLVVAEAQRLGVRIDPELLTGQYERAVDALEKEIQRNEKRKGMKLDTFVDRVLGLDPIRYRERIREDALRTLLGERVARAWLLASEHAQTHVIAVKSEDDLKAAQADLASGMSFEDVATKHSIDPTSKRGGRAPAVVKGDTAMGKIAFETAVGAIGGPVFESGAWLLVRVDERPAPVLGDWSVVGKTVEESLTKSPVDPLELAQWRAAMDKRYEIDPKPFLKLVGQ